MYLLEQSCAVFEFPILTNKSRVLPVYTLKQSHLQVVLIKRFERLVVVYYMPSIALVFQSPINGHLP